MTKKTSISTKIKSSIDGKTTVTLSKQIVDRDGETIIVKGINTENFLKNPIVLWGHRSSDGEVTDVMGRLDNLRILPCEDGDELVGDVTFADHPKAQYLAKMVKDKIINAVSIGFNCDPKGYDTETKTINQSELYELSFVMLPANTGAVVKSLAPDNLSEEIYKNLLNYDEIKPVVKAFRKAFLSDSFCKKLGYTKTGSEIVDVENLVEALDVRLAETEAGHKEPLENQEAPKDQTEAVVETPQAPSQSESPSNEPRKFSQEEAEFIQGIVQQALEKIMQNVQSNE